jgi:two-component system nitrogen regulation response regulator GlnG
MPLQHRMPTVLLIDDEPAIYQVLQNSVEGLHLVIAKTGEEGLAVFSCERPDVVLLDIGLPDQSGLETFRRLHHLDARVPVIFITGSGTTATAMEAMSLGAFDYVLKPPDFAQVRKLIGHAVEVARLMRVPAVIAETGEEQAAADNVVGNSPAMHAVYKLIGRVAPQDVTVLILGESGTGKELVARAIYQYSGRKAAPFLAINCSAIPELLLESELFGHEQGAFTGADKKHIGKFEQCNGGTLFLDEVGDMSPLTQTKILRLVQEQRFERVGGNQTIQTNVRMIAATNKNLEKLVAEGKFRDDLYYRLSVFAIKMPPLRERADDLPLLVDYFLRKYALEMDKNVNGIAPAALDLLRRYSWPGNVRELQSVIQHAILMASGSVIVPNFFPDSLRPKAAALIGPPATDLSVFRDLDHFIDENLANGEGEVYSRWLNSTELHLFRRILTHTKGNLSQAAKILGINRSTLRTKITALGLDAEERGTPREPNVTGQNSPVERN